jgi:hydroxymethylbilane synthase
LRLRAYVGSPDGTRTVRGAREGPASDAEAIGIALAHELRESGADAILAELATADSR